MLLAELIEIARYRQLDPESTEINLFNENGVIAPLALVDLEDLSPDDPARELWPSAPSLVLEPEAP